MDTRARIYIKISIEDQTSSRFEELNNNLKNIDSESELQQIIPDGK